MCFDPTYMDHHQARITIIKSQKVQIIWHTALWNLIMYGYLITKFRFKALSQNCEKLLLPSSCLSVRPRGTNRLPLDGFSWIWYLSIFRKICRKNSRSVKIWQDVRVLHTQTNTTVCSYLAHFFLEWEIFQTKFVQKIKTRVSFSITLYFRKSCRLWNNVETYFRAGQPTELNGTQAFYAE